MKHRKFLKRAINIDNQPRLTWGYVFAHDGKRVVATADGFRAHYVWTEEYPLDTPIPFEKSIPGGYSVKTAEQLKGFLENALAHEYDCVVELNGEQVRNGLLADWVDTAIVTIAGSKALILTDHGTLVDISATVIKQPATPVYAGFTGAFLRDATRNSESNLMLRIQSDDPNRPYFCGYPGSYASIIMPRSHMGDPSEIRCGTAALRIALKAIVEHEISEVKAGAA